MRARPLGDGDTLQAVNQTEVLGEFAEQNQAGMIGEQVEGRVAVRERQPWMAGAQPDLRLGRAQGRMEALGSDVRQAGQRGRGVREMWARAIDERMGRD